MDCFTLHFLTREFGITSRYWPFATLFLGLILLLCHSWQGPDIWYHLTWGRDIFTTGSFLPQVHVLLPQPIAANNYWLFQLLTFGLYSLGGIIAVSAVF